MQNNKDSATLTAQLKQQAAQDLLDRTKHDTDFYVLLVGAVIIAAFAIFDDSIPALIASMIVAPLATPILTLGLGVAVRSGRIIGRALGLLVIGCVIALGLAIVLTMLFGDNRVVDRFISFNGNHFDSFLVALVSGAIAAYGLIKPKVASAITGVAIAVSLLPPLVATGIGLAPGGATALNAFTLFLVNVLGILISSAVVFSLFKMQRMDVEG